MSIRISEGLSASPVGLCQKMVRLPAGLRSDEGKLRAVARPFDKARGIDALVLKKAGDLPPERVVAGNTGKMAGKPPAGKGHQGRGHGPAALDDQVVELTFRVGEGQAGMRPT